MKVLNNQQGSAVMIGIVTMLFMAIVIGGLLPLVSADVINARLNQDVVEAQYVAEAGVKRALVGFMQSRTDWAWANGTNRNTFQDGTTKTYIVSIANIAGITPAVIDGAIPASGTYTITSTGNVGNSSKTVSVQITMTAGGSGNENANGDVFSKYVIYDKGYFTIDGGNYPKIIGSMGLAGSDISINNNVNQFLDYKVYATKVPTGWRGYPTDWLVANGLYVKVNTPEEIGTLTIKMPTMPLMPDMPSIPTSVLSGADTFSTPGTIKGTEYYSTALSDFGGDLVTTAASVKIYATNGMHLTKKGKYNYGSITSDGDLILYVNGDLSLSNGSYIKAAKNITICTTGSFNITNSGYIVSNGGNIVITALRSNVDLNNASSINASGDVAISVNQLSLSGASYIKSNNSSIVIKANQGVSLTDNNNYVQAATSGNAELYSLFNTISLSQNCYVNGGNKVILQAKGNVNFANNSSVNNSNDYSSALTYVYANGSTFTNTVTLGGKASLVITTGPFDINSSVNATKTVFVSASGQSSISNSPKIAGIYTNGSLQISNKPTLTYSDTVMQALGLTGTTGGKANVTITNWSKL